MLNNKLQAISRFSENNVEQLRKLVICFPKNTKYLNGPKIKAP